MVSKERLEADFAAMQNITADGEGITRLAFTDEDWRARDYIIGQMKKAGLAVRVDPFGNVVGRREGADPTAAAVMLGSHIDSVPHGGNFDGVVGVLGAIEVVRHMEETGFQNEHPIEVVVFMAEESSRFGTATLGSKAMLGHLTPDDLKRLKDQDGTSLYDILNARGLDADHIQDAKYGAPVKAFLEIHIEQGKSLETLGKQIGIVTGIAAPTRIKAVLSGQADHSGATPMTMRQDALCAAAEVILHVESAAARAKEPPVVGTVGIAKVSPGVMNVIPGTVELGVDIRSISAEAKAAVVSSLREKLAELETTRKVSAKTSTLADETPVALRECMIDFLEGICKEKNSAYAKLPSGAGHDAMHWAGVAPTGMLFIPCRGGVSHNPMEWAKLEDIAAAADILFEAACKLSKASFRWDESSSRK